MPATSQLESLIATLVPRARSDDALRNELLIHCSDILNSHIGRNRESDIGHLADLVKRHLLQSSPNGAASLRFTNLLSRLLDQPLLERKHASLLFLYTLASTGRPSSSRAFLPALVPPPPTRPRTTTPTPLTPSSAKHASGKSKAELVRQYRAKTGCPELSEHLLLRDTLYLLQGISGKYVQFAPASDPNQERQIVFLEDPRYIISPPTKALIHRLSEVGHLYKRVDAWANDREKKGVGMIEQSLCHYLQTQLTEYYRLIAVLESQMVPASSAEDDRTEGSGRAEETGLTLRRLDVWISDWRLRMRMMSACVEGARDAHGGALVNLIHSYTDNGDPFVRRFTDELLEEVSKPFFATLHKWIFSGELYDPYSEFFVAVDPELAHLQYIHPSSLEGAVGQLSADGGFVGGDNDIIAGPESGLRLWEAKYQFQKGMLPAFVGEAFGRKIFSTGRSLNFIRYSCHDSDWVATREKLSNTGGTLKYSDIAGLERSIDTAYQIASRRLFDVFLDKFRLLDHLRALKNYMLLGHGDFTDQLMDALSPSLARPANALHRHNLTATLETALRSSVAQNDPPDVLRRLDARVLEFQHGEIGWDVFTLEYKVDAPIDTIIDPESILKYLKLFNHLWKLRRVEKALNKGWLRVTSGSRSFLRVPELEPEWHRIRAYQAEMIHYVRQMEAWCQLDVIECLWQVLLEFLEKKDGDLDALIEAHRTYLDNMVKKILLLSPKAGREETLLNQVLDLFAIILQFREAVDNFYNYCLSESARRDSQLDHERGVYTANDPDEHTDTATLERILNIIREYGTSFSEKAHAMVRGLGNHHDLESRSLSTRLSFSDFYSTKKEAHQKA
ncbi:gamma-tubulin complex, DGRIP91/SPC98 component [Gloeophyllum trabeum ATCC 11539]|uniref:Gamma-tubulin complex, DGRIP91/SPC98 component n=1 Tax=Gloeophyllum trabeum (strain ATCC 11539 / FP-39264 / Madison 617) TaxID=670483 RepID=S7QIQ2_GLOTA|nr:gamma-tubulin complex, DGRIP91/SPC98 component [Gloeophyllum trabeum ATCC 11539]EPQ59222.1 gamma-tubulin complex, DGRIP91/SPC98 component [Gloeophyllum trabeum ATCC 11539]